MLHRGAASAGLTSISSPQVSMHVRRTPSEKGLGARNAGEEEVPRNIPTLSNVDDIQRLSLLAETDHSYSHRGRIFHFGGDEGFHFTTAGD